MRIGTIAKAGVATGAAFLLTLAGAAGAQAGPLPTSVLTGHVDAVSIFCDEFADLTIGTVIGEGEEGQFIPTSEVDGYEFDYDRNIENTTPDAFHFDSPNWIAAEDELFEDDIPFVGFQYTDALSEDCPATIEIDAVAAAGATNTGDASFTSDAGDTSTAGSSRVVLTNPNIADFNTTFSHIHGEWSFGGTGGGAGAYDIEFDVYDGNGQVATVSPFQFRVI